MTSNCFTCNKNYNIEVEVEEYNISYSCKNGYIIMPKQDIDKNSKILNCWFYEEC